MELDQWLSVYQAVTLTASAKERSFWTLFAGGLIAECLLFFALVFLEPVPLSGMVLEFRYGFVAVGLFISLAWFLLQGRLAAEAKHLEGLLRTIESEFAGSEFHRSLHRFSKGQKICVAASDWTCDEWLPSVSRLSLLARFSARGFGRFVALALFVGWLVVLLELAAF